MLHASFLVSPCCADFIGPLSTYGAGQTTVWKNRSNLGGRMLNIPDLRRAFPPQLLDRDVLKLLCLACGHWMKHTTRPPTRTGLAGSRRQRSSAFAASLFYAGKVSSQFRLRRVRSMAHRWKPGLQCLCCLRVERRTRQGGMPRLRTNSKLCPHPLTHTQVDCFISCCCCCSHFLSGFVFCFVLRAVFCVVFLRFVVSDKM